MTEHRNKEIVSEYLEAWRSADTGRLRDLLAGDFTYNPPGDYENGREGYIRFCKDFLNAFPDQKLEIEKVLGDGDDVVVSWTMKGTHRGAMMGIPPSNNKVTLHGLSLVTVEDRKIRSDVTEVDAMGLLAQVGALPRTVKSTP